MISTQLAAWANGARQAETARQRPSTARLVMFIVSPVNKFQKLQCCLYFYYTSLRLDKRYHSGNQNAIKETSSVIENFNRSHALIASARFARRH
ncbi:MAG: hypothetical protein RSH52_35865, partial [Janthinobacterium sp.]